MSTAAAGGAPPAAPPPPAPPRSGGDTSSGGRGGNGRGGRGDGGGGRGNGNGNGNRRGDGGGRGSAGRGNYVSKRFEGREPSLRGFIYDYNGQKNPGQWITTTKEIKAFVGRTYKQYTRELSQAVHDLVLPNPTMPVLNDPNDFQQKELWKIAIRDHMNKIQEFNDFRAGLYAVVFGQCTRAMEERIRSHDDFNALDNDGIELLKLIRGLLHTYEERVKVQDALDDVKVKFYMMKQGQNMSLQDYHERFVAQVQVIEEVGATIADEGLVQDVAREAGREDHPLPADRVTAQERAITIRFIKGLINGSYLTHLRNSYLDGQDIYPETLHQAYNIVSRREEAPRLGNIDDGVAFTTGATTQGETPEENATDPVAATDGRVLPEVRCYGCQRMGHYANQCPFAQNGASLHTRNSGFAIPSTWILLDSQSTVDLFGNSELLSNVRESESRITIHCNAGSRATNLIGDLPGYGTVWYDPQAIANILSLRRVKDQFHIRYDNHESDQFTVTRPEDGARAVFQAAPSGLYYFNAEDEAQGIFGHESNTNGEIVPAVPEQGEDSDSDYMFVETVEDNKLNYTVADYSRALAARKLQIKIGRPSTQDYRKLITNNNIPNCPVTIRDVNMAEDIFGPDVGSLKGKTVRNRPHRVSQEILHHVPDKVLQHYQDVTICGDIMQVNGINMLLTISRNIKFCTIEAVGNKDNGTMVRALQRVQKIYQRGGFQVRVALFDGAFDSMRDDLAGIGIGLNTTSRDEHVGEAERMIRTVKERMRAIYNTLPFKKVPARLVIEMAKASVFWLNAFPRTGGISDTMSPRAIVVGQKIDYNKHCQYEFGEYVQTHEEHDNSMGSRTIGALALRPTGNDQGGYYFLSLSTGRVINRYRATPLPMPNEVVERVESMARQQRANPGLVFQNLIGGRVADPDYEEESDADDETYVPADEGGVEDDEYEYEGAYEDHEDEEVEEQGEVFDHDGIGQEDEVLDHREVEQEEHEHNDDVEDEIEDEIEIIFEQDNENDNERALFENYDQREDEQLEHAEMHPDEEPDENNDVLEQDMDRRYGERTQRYELRARRERNYDHLFVQDTDKGTGVAEQNTGVAEQNAGVAEQNAGVGEPSKVSLATEQMSLKQGLKRFGEAGFAALRKEIYQLHQRQVMEPCEWATLTREEKKRALAYLIFLKRKRCGLVKVRGCADGRPQREWTNPEDARSPTVSNESVFLTAVIDAKEGRVVAVVDVPGAFMQADMDELVHVRLEGPVVDMLLEIDKEYYSRFVGHERGRKVIYVRLLKALYGTLRAARLFWELLVEKLEAWGFEPNPYDPCVANKIVNGKQLTVAWHVDDLKVSHVEESVVEEFIQQMRDTFAKEAPLTESRGSVHDYLGMSLDFSQAGQLTVSMEDYVQGMLESAPDDMNGVAVTPASVNLFNKQSDKSRRVLAGKRRDDFVHLTMQALYLSQRARPDIRTAVSFLSGRIKEPDEDDYGKLKRLIKYLRGTADMKLTLSADDVGRISWWVDASYAVHDNMKGHTGATMSMGAGSVYSTSVKQKLVSRSSTESEVIGVYDVLPQVQWTFEFLKNQGVNVEYSTLYQDNMSAMLLEHNGRMSSTKRTKHMNVRYFYITDLVKKGDVVIEHCPTEDMLADYFTKPLQGKLFAKLRDLIMNYGMDSKYHSCHRSVLTNQEKQGKDEETVRASYVRSYRDVVVGDAGPPVPRSQD